MERLRPLVSIVITAYNYAELLPAAIESALAQDYDVLEVLVLDNASTDATPEVVARYASDPRFRAIRNETNIGLTPNHNKGLREATGDFIGFLSADDALTPGCVSRAMRYYEEHPEVDVLYGSAYFMNFAGNAYGIRQMLGQPFCSYAGGRNELASLLSEGCYMCTPTMLVRRSIWDRYGGFDETKRAADWELSARWAKHGLTFGYLPEALAVIRIHTNQHSGQAYVSSGQDMREYLDILEQYLDAATPQRYAGYEHAIRRLLDGRDHWLRSSLEDVAKEFDAALEPLCARLTSIAIANASRPRTRVCYVVVVEKLLGPLEATLRSLVAQDDPRWRAVVVQEPGLSYAPLCEMIDAARIRHIQTTSALPLGQMLNTAIRVDDADLYTVIRAGTLVGPGHTAALKAAFTDPDARLAVNWPRMYVDPPPGVEGDPVFIEEISRPPVGAFDVLVGPEVPLEAIGFARELYDRLNGYNPTLGSLADWDFLMRATLQASASFRSFAGALEVHLTPGQGNFSPINPNVGHFVRALHREYAVNEPERQHSRESYLTRLTAALRIDVRSQAGFVEFLRTLARATVAT